MIFNRHKPVMGKDGAAQAREVAREIEEMIEARSRLRIEGMGRASQSLPAGWESALQNDGQFVLDLARLRSAVRSALKAAVVPQPEGLRFQASSLFMRECLEFLIGDEKGNERMMLISGTVTEGTRVISRIVHVDNVDASPAFVRGARDDTHMKIVKLVERDQHPLFAMAHSHMMRGVETTQPSGIDLKNQQNFCSIGWDEVLGMIFNLDGYVRAFSTAHEFAFSIFGAGAEVVRDHPREKVFKIKRSK